ncbi:MAG: hypothetical protein H6923_02295 [Alphaproteobacteria bacterium]|nr:hypothetical protein [Alphaproteobacteria bacterium]
MSAFAVVTSLNRTLWAAYAQTCVTALAKALAPDIPLTVWTDGPVPQGLSALSRASVKRLEETDDYLPFLSRAERVRPPPVSEEHRYRFEYRRFWGKVCALAHQYMATGEGDVLVWIDADVAPLGPIDAAVLEGWRAGHRMVWLDRNCPGFAHAETGFLMLEKCAPVDAFVTELLETYVTGALFDYREWHDGFIVSALMRRHGMRIDAHNLNTDMRSLHPFETSPLKERLVHYKGDRKKWAAERRTEMPADGGRA